MVLNKSILSYIVGIALGDGNLSNPNGRSVRLRVTCDLKYKKLIEKICLALKKLLPDNKVSIIKRAATYCDISCYSNKWEDWLGWKAKGGSKYKQKVSIPKWIKNNKKYTKLCLCGLIETDGSIYYDRDYKMVNFVTVIPTLARDVVKMIKKIGFEPKKYKINSNIKNRYTIRISKNVDNFLKTIKPAKE